MRNSDMPAMPVKKPKASRTDDNYIFSPGLTKREQFAGLAMQGLLANPNIVGRGGTIGPTKVRDMAYGYADALLEKLTKGVEEA